MKLTNLSLPIGQAAPVKEPESDVMNAEYRWCAALWRGDTETLMELVDDDFRYTVDGKRSLTKSDLVSIMRSDAWSTREARTVTYELRSFEPNLAIVNTMDYIDGVYFGLPFKGHARVLRVWLKHNQNWRLCTLHATDARVETEYESLRKRTLTPS